ncbi:MAG: hypothetical protein QXI49_05430 [Candidatus Methanomethylicaceae archaeon]
MKSPGNSITASVGMYNQFTKGYYYCFIAAYFSTKINDWVYKQSDWVYVPAQSSYYLGSVTLTVRSDEPKGWKWLAIALFRYDDATGQYIKDDELGGYWFKVW